MKKEIKNYIKCPVCKGNGSVRGLGCITKKCSNCKSEGYLVRIFELPECSSPEDLVKTIIEIPITEDNVSRETYHENKDIDQTIKKKPGRPKKIKLDGLKYIESLEQIKQELKEKSNKECFVCKKEPLQVLTDGLCEECLNVRNMLDKL